ncbi:MAG TPA: COP23 domain-containing protein [Allocoleopsis sp.]
MKTQGKNWQLLAALTVVSTLTLTPITIKLVQAQTAKKINISQQNQPTILYVNPTQGKDAISAGESENTPYRTITFALTQAQSGTIIQLAPGQYEEDEVFPIKLKPGVILKGSEKDQGKSVVITGGGEFLSRTFAGQNITILAAVDSKISGITVTNPNLRGTGIWLESSNAIIYNNSLINSNREGIVLTGNSNPRIENNRFINNRGNGISITKDSGGEIISNLFDNTGFAITIGGNATPNVTNNQIQNNRDGIIVAENSSPRIAKNTIANNLEYGIVIVGLRNPEIGKNSDANNFANNGSNEILSKVGQKDTPPVASNNGETTTATIFNCVALNKGYATVAQRGSQTIPQPMITWNRTDLGPELTPERRCQNVTMRLNQLVADGGGSLDNMSFMIGESNNQSVVCLVKDINNEDCNDRNLVFTLSKKNAANPQKVLKNLLNFSLTGTGEPVQESTTKKRYVPLKTLDQKLRPEAGLWFLNSKSSK